ncbi:hypothetical protein MAP00_009072 [Monascus purpureus]|nr:hypothetical protein MAP00_009072 [Monascus purpureus]
MWEAGYGHGLATFSGQAGGLLCASAELAYGLVAEDSCRKFFLVEGIVLMFARWSENLTEDGPRQLIRDQGKIYTACGQGKIPFVSATDIAAVAYCALTDPDSHNCNHQLG